MDFLLVQVENEFHKLTGENAVPFVGRVEEGNLGSWVFPHLQHIHLTINTKLPGPPHFFGFLRLVCPCRLWLPASINKGDQCGSVAWCFIDIYSWQDAGFRLFPFFPGCLHPLGHPPTPVCSLPACFTNTFFPKSSDLFSALLNKSL